MKAKNVHSHLEIGQQVTRLKRERDELLATLRDLMGYVGGWDEPASHPCGKAAQVLKKYEKPE